MSSLRAPLRVWAPLLGGIAALCLLAAIAVAAPARDHQRRRGTPSHRACNSRARKHGRRRAHGSACPKPHKRSVHGSAPAGSTTPAAANQPGSSTSATPGTSPGPSTPSTTTPAQPLETSEPVSVPPSVPRVQVTAVEYSFSLSRTTVPAGKVVFEFVNHGQDEHNLNVAPGEGQLAGKFANTPSGDVVDQTIELRPGTYTLFCSLPEHEKKGMKATLVVE